MASPTVGKDSVTGAAVQASGGAAVRAAAAGNAVQADGHWVEYDQFVDQQIRKTRSQVKGTELAVALMTLATGTLGYFLLAALADHWLFAHGFGFWGRFIALVVYLAGAGWFCYRRVLPLVVMRINPIYAAETIERSRPSLKNTLMNFLFLRGEREHVPPAVYKAIEQQAATNLSHVSLETAVDRTRLVHVLYALLAVVVMFAAYWVFSTKNPFESVERVVMPWAKIDAPSRVTITDVRPGDKLFYRGEAVEVSAEIKGLKSDEPVRVIYTTADHQAVDQPAPMYVASGGYRHTVKLPPGGGGLMQDVDYRIEAGDAISPTYHLQSAIAPTIAVESIEYEYPAYTKRERRIVKDTGDILALEGTRVTIHARANQPIQSANLELEGDGAVDKQAARIDGQTVAVSFTLALSTNDHSRPQYAHYRLRPENRPEPQPVQYHIDVIQDLPPEIKFLAPQQEAVELPQNGRLTLEVRAIDPDYALSDVVLAAKSGDRAVLSERLLPDKHEGPLDAKFDFNPQRLGLQVGEKIEYWATARDNREPEANSATTPVRTITIVSPDRHSKPAGEVASNDKHSNDQRNGGQPDANHNPADANNQNANDPNAQPNQGDHRSDNASDKNAGHEPQNGSRDNNAGQQPPGANNFDHPQDRDPAHNNPEQNPQDKNPQDKNSQDKPQPKSDKSQDNQGSGEKSQDGGGKSGSQGSKSDQNNSGGKPGDESQGNNSSDGRSKSGQSKNSQNGSQQNSPNSQPSGDSSSGGAAGQNGQSNPSQSKSSQENFQNPGAAPQNGSDSAGGQKSQGGSANSGAGQQDKSSDGSNSGSKSQQSGGAAQQHDQQPLANDRSDDKAALKRTVDYLQKQSEKNTGQQKPSDEKQPGQPSGQQKPGQSDKQDGQQNPSQNNPQSNGQKPDSPSGDGHSGNTSSQSPDANSAQSQSGNNGQPGSASSQPGGKTGDKAAGNQPSGDKPAGDKPSGGKPSGDKPNSENAAGQHPQNQPGSNPQSAGQQKPAGDTAGSQKPNDAQTSSQQPNGQPANGQKPSGDGSNGQKPSGDAAKSNSQSGAPGQPSGSAPQPGAQNSQPQPGSQKSPSGEAPQHQPGDKSSDQKPEPGSGVGHDKADQHNEGDQQASGQGGKTNEGSNPTDKKPGSEHPKSDHPNAKGGDSDSLKGNSGNGQSSKTDDNGSPSPQQDPTKPVDPNKPDSGSPKQDKNNGASDDAASSPSHSPHESKSKGDQKGDTSGGGGAGGGQEANQPGTGGPGKNTAAEQGSGRSEGSGSGETSGKAGADKKSDQATGHAGNEQGHGSDSKSANPNDPHAKPGGEQSPNQPSPQDGGPQANSPQDQNSTASGRGSASGIPQGGSRAGPIPDSADYHGVKTGTEANLDYARKQFDLALDKLKKGNPDLLHELNWSADDARRLAERLEEMKKHAQLAGPQGDDARREMDDMLRSLGQRSGVLARGGDHSLNDSQHGLRESHDSGPPADYEEQFNAFQQGAVRGGR